MTIVATIELSALEISGPPILVGHSAGGLYIRKYAELHPERVEGLVFIDSTPEQIILRLRDIDRERALKESKSGVSCSIMSSVCGITN